MMLRNKATGEIRKAEAQEDGIYLYDESGRRWWKYDLDILAEFWEYYVEPKEPLIEDVKKREAIRDFFDMLDIDKVIFQCKNNCFYHTDNDGISYSIDFDNDSGLENLKNSKKYTITELCGEE